MTDEMPNNIPHNGLRPRIERLESDHSELKKEVKTISEKVEAIDRRAADTESQLARVVSHIESESMAARSDISRLEIRLLGPIDNPDGGHIGKLSTEVTQLKVWFRAIAVTGSILMFGFLAYEFITHLK